MDEKKGRKHSAEVRIRAFQIWQKLGVYPWTKDNKGDGKKRSGAFYKGAFDVIPFLNNDAKRTFTHLLLRPGYMIRDYIRGEHERYLAPLTALIIFYAFFALVSSILQPVQKEDTIGYIMSESNRMMQDGSFREETVQDTTMTNQLTTNVLQIVQKGYIYMNLDRYPDEVRTQGQASLAAIESALRSQGITLFIGDFIILWLAMAWALRRQKLSMSACAAASAYVLCQFSFFMLFALLLTLGRSTSISAGLMLILLVVDYRQWLGLSWSKSIKRTLVTGVLYAFLYGLVILAVSGLVLLLAYFRINA